MAYTTIGLPTFIITFPGEFITALLVACDAIRDRGGADSGMAIREGIDSLS